MSSETPLTPPTWTDPAATTATPIPTAPIAPSTAAAAPVAVAIVPKRRSAGWMNLLLGAAALVAVGGVAFAVGRSTAPAATPPFGGLVGDGTVVMPDGSFDPGAFPGGDGGAGGPNVIGGLGGPSIDGTVTAIDTDSITISLANGEEMTIALDDETTYHASTDASAADVAVGDEVAVGVDGFARGPGSATDGNDGETPLTADDVTVSR